jgi:hypothetical protein
MTCGPLEVLSVVTTRVTSESSLSVVAVAECMQATEVAQAWEIIGPVTPGAPILAATDGAP